MEKKESQSKSDPPPKNKYVFLDVAANGLYLGRIEIELYKDLPDTIKNFESLCSGDKGMG